MIVYAARRNELPPPPRIVFESLTDPHKRGARPWLTRRQGEVAPRVLDSRPTERVVWSSIWRDRPDDRIVFELAPEVMPWGGTPTGTLIRFELEARDDDVPDEADGRWRRKRISELIFGDLRASYGS